MRFYDRTLIITLITGTPLTLLAMSCAVKNQPVDIIELSADHQQNLNPLSAEDVYKLTQLTQRSRIYIFGHGNTGLDILGNNINLIVHYTQISHMITTHVNHNANGLRVCVFGCHGAADSQPNMNDSFAAKLHYQLAVDGMMNIDLTAYTDSKAIRMSTDIQKIYKYSKSEKAILDSLADRRRTALLHAKRKFIQQVADRLKPDAYDHNLLSFIENELTDEIMLDNAKLRNYLEICMQLFVNDKLYELFPNAKTMSTMLVQLFISKIQEYAKQALDITSRETINAVKYHDRNRPFSKVLFTWHNNTQTKLDAYQVKAWEEQTAAAIGEVNPLMEQAFINQRSLIDKLSFLNRAREYQNEQEEKTGIDKISYRNI